jgi:CRP-like cAMP-binding protein
VDIVDMFEHSSDVLEFEAGHVLFCEGDEGDNAYVILDGEIEIVALSNVFEVAGPGDVIGEMALISSAPRTAAARVKTDCEVVPIDQQRFLFMVEKMPEFSLYVMKILARRLANMDITGEVKAVKANLEAGGFDTDQA